MKNTLLFILVLIPFIVDSQTIDCGMINPGNVQTRNNSCDVDPAQLTTKRIRIIFHVFQKNDGSENIPNNTDGKAFINDIVNGANGLLTSLSPMNLNSP